MEQLENYRYRVSMKKGYKIFHVIVTLVVVALAAVMATTVMEQGLPMATYLVRALATLGFVVVCLVQMMCIRKRVDVYKGKILYFNGLQTKSYKPSEICKSITSVEVIRMDTYNKSYHTVTTFYDMTGRKLFKFDLAFQNLERLKEDIQKTRKSIANSKKSKKHTSRW